LIDGRLQDLQATTDDMPKVGFALFLFTFGEGGWLTYISNAERDTMLQALVEFIERQGGPAVGPEVIEALIVEADGVEAGRCRHCGVERSCDLTGAATRCINDGCWSNRVRKALAVQT